MKMIRFSLAAIVLSLGFGLVSCEKAPEAAAPAEEAAPAAEAPAPAAEAPAPAAEQPKSE